jgi:hypothetical protein
LDLESFPERFTEFTLGEMAAKRDLFGFGNAQPMTGDIGQIFVEIEAIEPGKHTGVWNPRTQNTAGRDHPIELQIEPPVVANQLKRIFDFDQIERRIREWQFLMGSPDRSITP